ncbi:hypothetical protein M434DRAFT_235396 [Hypoxylon sp. CO27-5]|nr:hypothetical protein M434DRAFT_235396 [Hypoxylon sp. CO27-5]
MNRIYDRLIPLVLRCRSYLMVLLCLGYTSARLVSPTNFQFVTCIAGAPVVEIHRNRTGAEQEQKKPCLDKPPCFRNIILSFITFANTPKTCDSSHSNLGGVSHFQTWG